MNKYDFSGQRWEPKNIILIDSRMVTLVEKWITSCEGCTSDVLEIPFDSLLDEMIGSDPKDTDYLLERLARCSRCNGAVTEKTLIGIAR
jgi:hypothetical protein